MVIQRGHPFEVATFRSDQAYIDGRRPSGVVFTDARRDVLRRDFTINGLLYDPVTKEIIDYVSGQEDIQAKIVRAIGDPIKRFEEDKLRLLRAIRFGARLDYTIEPATWEAVRAMASQIHQVSSERVRDELLRILTEGQPALGMRMLEESGLRREILPELKWDKHIENSLQMLKRNPTAAFAMAVLLHETPVPLVRPIVERLKFSRLDMHHIVALVENLPKFDVVRQMTVSGLKRFFRLPRFEDHLELTRVHAAAAGDDLSNYRFASQQFLEWPPSVIAPPLLVTGEDLIEIGYSPGPLFKEILTRVEDEQLEGRISTREEGLTFVRTHYRETAS